MATVDMVARGSTVPAAQMTSEPCSRKRRKMRSAFFGSFSLSLLTSTFAKRSQNFLSCRRESPPPSPSAWLLLISSASFPARCQSSMKFLCSFRLAARCLSRLKSAPRPMLSMSSSSPSASGFLLRFFFLLGNIFFSSSFASQLLSEEKPLWSESSSPSLPSSSFPSFSFPSFFSFSASCAFATSSARSFSSFCWSSSSLGVGRIRSSFISWSSWKRSASPPLSGWSSSAFLLKAFLTAAWLAEPGGMPRKAQAARRSRVFRRPLAFTRQSWRLMTSSWSSWSLISRRRLSRPVRPPANSSTSRPGSSCPNLFSKSTRSIRPPLAARFGCAAYARQCLSATPHTLPNIGSTTMPGPKSVTALAVSALPCHSSWSTERLAAW
mmetsp:Transcript_63833/g.179691  ORF Transcript_63833/g.179691 Transcript_63833/m.179691 type:complete len:381 (+) Transcript_63833:462-1604(+)